MHLNVEGYRSWTNTPGSEPKEDTTHKSLSFEILHNKIWIALDSLLDLITFLKLMMRYADVQSALIRRTNPH